MSHTDQPRHRRRVALGLAVAALAVGPLAACGGDDDAPVADPAQDTAATTTAAASVDLPAFGLVTAAEASELATVDGVTVIDVRTPDEYAEGHIDGATMIDFYEPDFADQIAGLDRGGEYLLYCRSGNRSGQTAQLMADLGFEQVWDLDGGVNAYSAGGFELVK